MTTQNRVVRVLTATEVEFLIGWAALEGWNPGIGDAAAFHAADPQGFIGAFVGGEMVAGISAVAYDDRYGFIGLYITRADRRGEGHGRAVWDAAMARLASHTIGLDGVPAQQANYRSMGFLPSYRTHRYSGRPNMSGHTGTGIVSVTPDLLPAVLELDLRCFPAARAAFLEDWLSPPRNALAMLREGRIRGIGVVRPCGEGWKIGPLFADGVDLAIELSAALAERCDGAEIHIDVPEAQTAFANFIASAGLSPGFCTARMYRGAPPELAAASIYGVTTLELG